MLKIPIKRSKDDDSSSHWATRTRLPLLSARRPPPSGWYRHKLCCHFALSHFIILFSSNFVSIFTAFCHLNLLFARVLRSTSTSHSNWICVFWLCFHLYFFCFLFFFFYLPLRSFLPFVLFHFSSLTSLCFRFRFASSAAKCFSAGILVFYCNSRYAGYLRIYLSCFIDCTRCLENLPQPV